MLISVQNVITIVIKLDWYNYFLKQRNFMLFLSIFNSGRHIYYGEIGEILKKTVHGSLLLPFISQAGEYADSLVWKTSRI